MNEIAVRTEINLIDKDLRKATETIYKIGSAIKSNLFHVAYIVAEVDENESYKKDGFASVHKWVEEYFGFKKSTSYNLLKIGREYVEKFGTGFNTVYRTNLVEEGRSDFSPSQVALFLPFDYDEIKEYVENGDIYPEMTVREIQDFLKAVKNESESDPEEDSTGDGEEIEEAPAEIKMVTLTVEQVAEIINELAKVKNKKSVELITKLNELLSE